MQRQRLFKQYRICGGVDMSNNVLWAGYRTDCYVGVVSGEIISFSISASNNWGCYFGKLKPNTTYTIKRLDTSSRMRIGVSNTDYSTIYTSANPANYTHAQIIDSNDPHTFTTNANAQYIVVYYTNTSETNIRVMLNEGSTSLPYEPPTVPIPYSWIITDGINNNYPYLSSVPLPAETTITEPYPTWTWRIDQFYNDGYPYLIGLRPPDYHVDPIKQKTYISVFDSRETDFEHNGLRILCPLSCEITEELNGTYELSLSHPVDEMSNWMFLLDKNIIKADGQLFRIYDIDTSMSNDGNAIITVKALHIWYDLRDNYLADVRPTLQNGQGAIDWILGKTYEPHNFIGVSDIAKLSTAYYMDVSPVMALLGADNAYITRWGGELYRNNFNFSINSRRGKDNAFNIRYGMDMTSIQVNINSLDQLTKLIATDNFGNKRTIIKSRGEMPHHKVKAMVFTYDVNDVSVLQADAKAYIDDYYDPLINYSVTFATLKNTELYKDFSNLQSCNLGDTGTIYNELLKINTVQKIIKKTVNVLTGEVISIELGKAKKSITRPARYTNTMSPQDTTYVLMQQVYKSLQENIATTSPTWASCKWAWNRLHLVAWDKFK